MEILTAVLFSTGISLIISAFAIEFIVKQMLEYIKTENKFDEYVVESINYLKEKIDKAGD